MTPELNKDIINYIQTVTFEETKGRIYLYPLDYLGADAAQLVTIRDLQMTCPAFDLYGFVWFYIVHI